MTKEERHQHAEKFRREIVSPAQRAVIVKGFTSKSCFDEKDDVELSILLKKVSLAQGCEQPYKEFLAHLMGVPAYKDKALSFYRQWHG